MYFAFSPSAEPTSKTLLPLGISLKVFLSDVSNYYELGFTNATYQDLVKLCNFYGFTVKYAYNLCDESITIYLESKGLINKIYIFININDYNYTVGNMLSYFGFRMNIKQNLS